jgi:integrase
MAVKKKPAGNKDPVNMTNKWVESRDRLPTTGRAEYCDITPGLFLWVRPNGIRTWMAIYKLPGADGGKRTVRRKKALGRYPTLGIAAARDEARALMALAVQGIDPEAKKAEARAAEQAATAERRAQSFRTVAEEYVAAMKAGKKVGGRKAVTLSTAIGRESLLTRLVLPTLGDTPLSEISKPMIASLLSRIEKEGGPVDATLKNIRLVFRFAQARWFEGRSPTEGMKNRQAPVKITRALSDEELRAVWRATQRQGGSFGAVVRMLMLTGQRRSEIAELRWDEVDWDRQLLLVPADRVKNRAGTHEVPLTAPALAILREMQDAYEALSHKSGLVFPSETGDTPISGWTPLRAKLNRTVQGELADLSDAEWRSIRAGGALRPDTRKLKAEALAKIAATPTTPWRLHDLRHTFITRCRDGEENAAGEITWSAPLDVLQATVNHEITAGVTRVYDHGDLQRRYQLRKRELLEWWSRKLMTIVEGGAGENVVPMTFRRSGR